MNNQLTLLMFLKDRAEFTGRLVYYLSQIRYPFKVIFADGSIGDENEELFKSLKCANFSYEYVRYPKDETLRDYYQKCASSIKKVKTPYVMLADNDDFPIVEGQLKAINFLENNQDYVGCNGRVGGVIVAPLAHIPYGKRVLYLDYYCNAMDRNIPVNQSVGTERIKSYLTNFYSIFYSVYKTESLKTTLDDIQKLNFSDLGIHELFFSYMQLAQGKIHTLDALTYIRQKGSSQAASTQKDWFYRLFYTQWLADLKNAIHQVAQVIANKEKLNSQSIYELLYEDFIVRQRARFMPTSFYFYKNPKLFFNKENVKFIILHKLFKVFPIIGEWLSFKSLSSKTSKINLEIIREIIIKRNND